MWLHRGNLFVLNLFRGLLIRFLQLCWIFISCKKISPHDVIVISLGLFQSNWEHWILKGIVYKESTSLESFYLSLLETHGLTIDKV